MFSFFKHSVYLHVNFLVCQVSRDIRYICVEWNISTTSECILLVSTALGVDPNYSGFNTHLATKHTTHTHTGKTWIISCGIHSINNRGTGPSDLLTRKSFIVRLQLNAVKKNERNKTTFTLFSSVDGN